MNIKSIIKEWKEQGTSATLPRGDRPPKVSERIKKGLVRELTKRTRRCEGAGDPQLRWEKL